MEDATTTQPLFAVRREPEDALFEDRLSIAQGYEVAWLFAAANNTQSVSMMKDALAPKVDYRSHWADVELSGRRAVLKMFRRVYGVCVVNELRYRSQVVLLEDGSAAVATAYGEADPIESIARFEVADGQAVKVRVEPYTGQESIRRFNYFPPAT